MTTVIHIWKLRGRCRRIPLLVLSGEVFFLRKEIISSEGRVNSKQEEFFDGYCNSRTTVRFRNPSASRGLFSRAHHRESRRTLVSNDELSIQEHGTCSKFICA